jgi:hypothetical protein
VSTAFDNDMNLTESLTPSGQFSSDLKTRLIQQAVDGDGFLLIPWERR